MITRRTLLATTAATAAAHLARAADAPIVAPSGAPQ